MSRKNTELASLDNLLVAVGSFDQEPTADQRSSFAYASARLEGLAVARESIRILEGETFYADRIVPAGQELDLAARNLLLQFDFIVAFSDQHCAGRRPCLTSPLNEETAKRLHNITMKGIIEGAGTYRDGPIVVKGSEVEVAKPHDIAPQMKALFDYLGENWKVSSPSHLAAFALWRILWIHPFSDGNGRVGRAISYLIFCLKAGIPLPGTPTLPELINRNRGSYFTALKSADDAQTRGRVDVSALRKLLERLLVLQLSNTPDLDREIENRIQRVISDRILNAPELVRRLGYESSDPDWRVWSLGSYLLLHVANARAIKDAVGRQMTRGSPFPRLLGRGRSSPAGGESTRSFQYLSEKILSVEMNPIYLFPNTAMALERCVVMLNNGQNYNIGGTIFVVRTGALVTISNFDQSIDLAAARQIGSLLRSGGAAN